MKLTNLYSKIFKLLRDKINILWCDWKWLVLLELATNLFCILCDYCNYLFWNWKYTPLRIFWRINYLLFSYIDPFLLSITLLTQLLYLCDVLIHVVMLLTASNAFLSSIKMGITLFCSARWMILSLFQSFLGCFLFNFLTCSSSYLWSWVFQFNTKLLDILPFSVIFQVQWERKLRSEDVVRDGLT